MSLVVTLKPGMSGYEKHRMDYLISNYNGEYGYLNKNAIAEIGEEAFRKLVSKYDGKEIQDL